MIAIRVWSIILFITLLVEKLGSYMRLGSFFIYFLSIFEVWLASSVYRSWESQNFDIISKDWVGRDSFLVKWEDSTEEDGHRRRSSDRRDSSISGKLTENPIDIDNII